jgi:hypothetical protein
MLFNDGVEGGGRTARLFGQGICRARGYHVTLTAGYQVVFTGVSVGKERFVRLVSTRNPHLPVIVASQNPSCSRHLDNQNAQTQRAEIPY